MHAQTLFLSILAAGIAVQALPAVSPSATVSLAETTNEAPAAIEPALLPREPKPEPEAETETGEQAEPGERKPIAQAGNPNAVACNGTVAGSGQQAAAQGQGANGRAGTAKPQGRSLIMPRDPTKKAAAGGTCVNAGGAKAHGTAAAGSAQASGAAAGGKTLAEKKAAAEKAVKKNAAEKKAKAKAKAKKAKAAAEKKAQDAAGGL